ncbi:MAG: SDR family NAD(P)-dependent oxidoreductase [Tardiphaga sp.]
MKLTNDIAAVVTGAASGLGFASAKALAAAGVKVALFDKNAEKGAEAAAEIGGVFVEVDILSEESVEAGFAKARAAIGQERILIACAGGGSSARTIQRNKETGELSRLPTATFEFITQLNLVATYRCLSISALGMAALDPLEDNERGAIVLTASIAAQDARIGQIAYGATKAGVNGLVLPAARDLASYGIRVNSIMPGTFSTPPMLGIRADILDALAKSIPFPKRLGNPEEFASLALEMVRNNYFNAQTVRLDGAVRFMP